jgi:GT2 family glycosyltransferase
MSRQTAAQTEITVVVCTRDRPSDLRRCLTSLVATLPPGCRVIVVDQSSSADSASVFNELAGGVPGFEYLVSGRTGLSVARNQGAALATSGLILFTDDDCEVTAEWVHEWRRFFEANPAVGMGFGPVGAPEFDADAGHIPQFDPGDQDRVWGREVFWRGTGFIGMGANMAVRHEVLVSVDGFDEALGAGARFPAAEEVDLALRAAEAGYRLGHAARPIVTHYGLRTSDDTSLLFQGYGVGNAAMYLKHIRCRDRYAAMFLARDIGRLLARVARNTLTGVRPTGFNSLRGLLLGIPLALGYPVDVNRRVYTGAVVPVRRRRRWRP